MTITLGSFTNARLTVQPFGYEGEARDGLTARTFTIGGLLSSTQWQALVAEYNTWRNLRIADPDTLSSGTVGTTINLTISSTNGLSITSLPCWFVNPPSGDQIGPFINATATLVDAAQALAVELRTQEKSRQRSELLPDLGTLTFGSAVVTLTKPADTRQDGPTVALTATGTSLVTGALKAHKIRQVEGYLTGGTYANLLTWYDTTIRTSPATGAWFPIAAPTATAEAIVSGGVKSTRFAVQLTVLEII
jgi:hypothetical protein